MRRLGAPALVLCPSQTIQRQWGEKQALFGGRRDDLHLLTYQSLCQADDPDGMLRERGRAALGGRARARRRVRPPTEVAAEAAAWTGAAAERRAREVGRLVARLKQQAAAGQAARRPA